MREREFVLKDYVDNKDTIILITPDTWTVDNVKELIGDVEYKVFELTHWSTKMIDKNSVIMTVRDWLYTHNPENADELYRVYVELESTND